MRAVLAVISAMLAAMFLSAAAFAQPQLNFTKLQSYQLPDYVGKMIGDARVNIYDYDNNVLGSIVVLNGTVNSTGPGLLGNATHKIFVRDAATFQSIMDSDGFVKEFNRQRSLHNIDVQAVGLLDQMRLMFWTMLASVASVFIAPQ